MSGARYEVQICNPLTGKPKLSTHDTREAAEGEAAKLRVHKMFAQVRRVDDAVPERPEHGNDRSVAEVEREARKAGQL